MKPVALIERTINNATELRGLVVDPFLGSGTAIIAAERTGRRCYGFDLEARYCDVILSRWESFTGQEAVKLARRPCGGLDG
jgi:DNA modification methylase